MHSELADERLTPQRRAVLGVLHRSHDHPSAADVLDRVRELAPGIGAATVYRSLAHLVSTGQALEIQFRHGASRYDANVEHHDHVVCDICGKAVDVPAALTGSAGTFAARVHDLAMLTGFDVTSYDLRFHGRCSTCRTETPAGSSST
jgi:Fur family peroxide stress response transcriptional regulator